jgi:hypothetical protein
MLWTIKYRLISDTGKILVLPVLYTSIVVPVSRPAASYYPSIVLKFEKIWLSGTLNIIQKRYWKILENTGNISIANTGRFWKILVIPVLQILEN